MKIFVSTQPPLGEVSVVDQSLIVFKALLEFENSQNDDEWQMSLWLSDSEAENWTEKHMEPVKNTSFKPVGLEAYENGSDFKRLFFTVSISIQTRLNFTIKFRKNSNQSWEWSRDHLGTTDGIVIVKSKSCENYTSSDLGKYVQDLNPFLKCNKLQSKNKEIAFWSIDAPIESANGEISTVKEIKLGTPWGKGKFLRWMAIVRSRVPWLGPRQGKTEFKLDKGAIMCSFLNDQGKHMILLAISYKDHVMTLLGSDDEGNMVIQVRNDGIQNSKSRVLLGIGDSFESTIAILVDYARDIVTKPHSSGGKERETNEKDKNVIDTHLVDWYDGFTYCTWNALGQSLTEDKILDAVTILAENNINVVNFIIDDNWQSIDYRGDSQYQHGWIEFEAERKAFPKGLKHTVDKIREKHPSIKHVAVWHAILGYWGGIAPNGKLIEKYETIKIAREDSKNTRLPIGGEITVIGKEDVAKFYDDFYRFLSSCGIDMIKTDVQSMLDSFISAEARRNLIPAYLDAWTSSAVHYFDSRAISCMSQTPQSLFYSQMPKNKPRFLVRNSDDFYPEIPASHPWHVFSNAHNSLLTHHLNSIPDWDMFQTIHEYSGYHAAARCVSGGPIYITDVPGQHDINLIDQITGCTAQGKTIILRPSMIGKSLRQYTDYNDGKLLLIGTNHKGAGIMGIFNVSQRSISELILLAEFPGITEGSEYIIRAYKSRVVSRPLRVNSSDAIACVSLSTGGYEILTAYPLTKFISKNTGCETLIANLGLLGKMTGVAALIQSKSVELEDGTIQIETQMKTLGTLGIYISTLTNLSHKAKITATISGKSIPKHALSVGDATENILEIDTAIAWKDLELEGGSIIEVKYDDTYKHLRSKPAIGGLRGLNFHRAIPEQIRVPRYEQKVFADNNKRSNHVNVLIEKDHDIFSHLG